MAGVAAGTGEPTGSPQPRGECVVDSCGEPSEYAGAYRLGARKIILEFCEQHFDATRDDRLGFDPARGDDGGDPVGLLEIAQRLGVGRQTPQTWRHRGLMPKPDFTVSGLPAWQWSTIAAWAAERQERLSRG